MNVYGDLSLHSIATESIVFFKRVAAEIESRVNRIFESLDLYPTAILQKPIDKSVQFPFDVHFGKTLAINLKNATDKKELLADHLSSIGVHNWERFDAVNGYTLSDDYCPIDDNSTTFKDFYLRMPGVSIKHKKARAGCYLSHLNLLKEARKIGLKSVLILEDDALFSQSRVAAKIFKKTMRELPKNWEMLFLGFEHYKRPTLISENVVKIEAGFCMHAYAVHQRCFDRLIKDLESWIIDQDKQMQPVDAVVSELFEKQQYNAYAPRALIGFQRDDVTSNITGNSNSPYSVMRNICHQFFMKVVTPILGVFGIKQYHLYNAIGRITSHY